jgi:hypothetical protein
LTAMKYGATMCLILVNNLVLSTYNCISCPTVHTEAFLYIRDASFYFHIRGGHVDGKGFGRE